jgi:hypothetical protein
MLFQIKGVSIVETEIKEVSESKALLTEAVTLAAQYETYKVYDNLTLTAADSDLTLIKKKIAAIEKARIEISRSMEATKQLVMKPYVDATTCLEKSRLVINKEMTTYRTEQERIRQEQERKLQEAARREEERKRKELEERAKKAEASGKAEKAEELRAKAGEVYVPTPVIQSSVAETKNKPRKVWKYRVTDLKLVPDEYKMIDDVKTGAVVRATKGTLAIPGIEIFSEDSKF